ncbi:MAG TPA: hypothetical protein VK171_05625, partial [Fimbriimonas sp.]|nr:hypothetical protein [Fimbriimonas sp.]
MNVTLDYFCIHCEDDADHPSELCPRLREDREYHDSQRTRASYYRSRQYRGDQELQEADLRHEDAWNALSLESNPEYYIIEDENESIPPSQTNAPPSIIETMSGWVLPVALTLATVTVASVRSLYTTITNNKQQNPPEDAIKEALGVDDETIQGYLRNPEQVVIRSVPTDFDNNKLQAVVRALARNIKHQEVLEESLSAVADRLEQLDAADPARVALETERNELQEQLTKLSLRMDVTREQMTKAHQKMTLIMRTTSNEARNRRASRFAAFLARVNRNLAAGSPPSDHDSDQDTATSRRTDALNPAAIPPAVGTPFPAPTPGMGPNSRKPYVSEPPFLYDGSPKTWSLWKNMMISYIDAEAATMLFPINVVNLFQNRTKEGSRAMRRMNAISTAIVTPGTP